MALAPFLIGAGGAAWSVHILSLELDDYTASLDIANYKGAGSAESFKPPFSLEPYLKRQPAQEHPSFTAFREKWNGAIWKARDQVLGLFEDKEKKAE